MWQAVTAQFAVENNQFFKHPVESKWRKCRGSCRRSTFQLRVGADILRAVAQATATAAAQRNRHFRVPVPAVLQGSRDPAFESLASGSPHQTETSRCETGARTHNVTDAAI
jgi:hypothetical protein